MRRNFLDRPIHFCGVLLGEVPGELGYGLPVPAIIVRDEDGRGRSVNERPEQQLKFFRAVFRKPADGFWLRGHYLCFPALLRRSMKPGQRTFSRDHIWAE
jgi:hypothetical protein